MAQEFSQDPGTRENGGELGFFKKGELVPEYEAAAKKLNPGEISEPVESQFGFHLIQLIERKGLEYNTRHILMKPEASSLDGDFAKDFLRDLRDKIVKDSITFESAARKFSDDKLTSSSGGLFVNPNTASTEIPLDELEPNVFFIIDKMREGEISDPIPYIANDGKEGYRIIYFRKKIKPHYANLTDDYTKISEVALSEKKSIELEKWFKNSLSKMYIDVDEEYKDCNLLKQ